MVAVVLGKKTSENKCRLLTLNERADDPTFIEFPLPTDSEPLKPGKPNWANYVKGIVQYFDGKGSVFL